jgi:hypothetical protein
MKKWFISSLAVAVVAGWTVTSVIADEDKHDKGKPEKKPETIQGEVIDMACYLDHGAHGDKHKECAVTCIKGGLPVGILTDKEVYLIIGDHKPINDKLEALAAQKVKVTGVVSHNKGVHMIVVKDPDKDIVKE